MVIFSEFPSHFPTSLPCEVSRQCEATNYWGQ